jgi:mRNA-degrading endonuclease RelE of RelBE toxin-antitoxin system
LAKNTRSTEPRYKVIFDERAEKEFAALSQGQRKAIFDKLKLLETDPAPPGSVELKKYAPLRRIKAGDARAIYDEPDGNDRIFVLRIGTDQSIYQNIEALVDNDASEKEG